MFQISKYTTDAITGKVDVAAYYQIKTDSRIIEIKNCCSSDMAAKNWLRKEMTGYILAKLEAYIIHKKNIIEGTYFQHASLTKKKEALSECLRYLQWACNNPDLREICKWAVTMYPKLELILPNEKNASHESSRKQLNEIIEFAREHQGGAILRHAN